MPTARAGAGGNFKNPSEGPHIAICFAVVSLGTQKREFAGQSKSPELHVRLGFELCEDDDVNEDGTRMVIWSRKMLLDLGDKANLRKFLDGWRGRSFTPQELEGFDLSKVCGIPCQLTVSIDKAANGKEYANIKGVSMLHKSMKAPDTGREPYVYEIEDGPSDTFKKIPNFIQKEIFESAEAIGGHHAWPGAGGKSSERREQANAQSDGATDFGDNGSDDEVPF